MLNNIFGDEEETLYQKIIGLYAKEVPEVAECNRRIGSKSKFRIVMRRCMIATFMRKNCCFEGHEVLHQQIALWL